MPKTQTKKLTYDIYNKRGEKLSQESFTSPISDISKNSKLLAQAVRIHLLNQRQGTVSTKTRGEVAGSTRKIYRQKGTGRARHGDIKAPIFIGGGIVFGPKPRDFDFHLTTEMRKKAFLISIIDKISNNQFKVVSGLEKMSNKTRDFYKMLQAILTKKIDKEKILVINNSYKNLFLAARNIKGVTISPVNIVNTFEILSHSKIIIDKNGIKKLFSRLGISLP